MLRVLTYALASTYISVYYSDPGDDAPAPPYSPWETPSPYARQDQGDPVEEVRGESGAPSETSNQFDSEGAALLNGLMPPSPVPDAIAITVSMHSSVTYTFIKPTI